jgi:hypothetical protein
MLKMVNVNDFQGPDAGTRFAQRRTVPRYPFVGPVEILDILTRTRLVAQIVEISLRGCYLATLNSLESNSVIELRIRQDHEIFEALARVARVEEGKGMGIAFLKIEPPKELLLREWITRLSSSKAAHARDATNEPNPPETDS